MIMSKFFLVNIESFLIHHSLSIYSFSSFLHLPSIAILHWNLIDPVSLPIIYFNQMINKIPRKTRPECPLQTSIRDMGSPSFYKIKFDTSKNNISCFIGHKAHTRKHFSNKSLSITKGRMSSCKNRPMEDNY